MVSPAGRAAGAAARCRAAPLLLSLPLPRRRSISASCFGHLCGPPAEALDCPVRTPRDPWWLLETGAPSCPGHRAEPRKAPEPLLMAHLAALWFLTSFHSGERGYRNQIYDSVYSLSCSGPFAVSEIHFSTVGFVSVISLTCSREVGQAFARAETIRDLRNSTRS